MALHHPPTYVRTPAARLSPAECQSHVDARTFLIPLRLVSLDPDGGGQAGADLGGASSAPRGSILTIIPI